MFRALSRLAVRGAQKRKAAAATRIQALARARQSVRLYGARRWSATVIQTSFMRCQARRNGHRAAVKVQSRARAYVVCCEFKRQHRASVHIQAQVRVRCTCNAIRREHRAARSIQMHGRKRSERKQSLGAACIQRTVRVHQAQHRLHQLRRTAAAAVILRRAQGHQVRRRFLLARPAATAIANGFRCPLAHKEAARRQHARHRAQKSAITIQTHLRGKLARENYESQWAAQSDHELFDGELTDDNSSSPDLYDDNMLEEALSLGFNVIEAALGQCDETVGEQAALSLQSLDARQQTRKSQAATRIQTCRRAKVARVHFQTMCISKRGAARQWKSSLFPEFMTQGAGRSSEPAPVQGVKVTVDLNFVNQWKTRVMYFSADVNHRRLHQQVSDAMDELRTKAKGVCATPLTPEDMIAALSHSEGSVSVALSRLTLPSYIEEIRAVYDQSQVSAFVRMLLKDIRKQVCSQDQTPAPIEPRRSHFKPERAVFGSEQALLGSEEAVVLGSERASSPDKSADGALANKIKSIVGNSRALLASIPGYANIEVPKQKSKNKERRKPTEPRAAEPLAAPTEGAKPKLAAPKVKPQRQRARSNLELEDGKSADVSSSAWSRSLRPAHKKKQLTPKKSRVQRKEPPADPAPVKPRTRKQQREWIAKQSESANQKQLPRPKTLKDDLGSSFPDPRLGRESNDVDNRKKKRKQKKQIQEPPSVFHALPQATDHQLELLSHLGSLQGSTTSTTNQSEAQAKYIAGLQLYRESVV